MFFMRSLGGIMYEPTEREISIEICKTLNKIEEKLNWLIGSVIGVIVAIVINNLFHS